MNSASQYFLFLYNMALTKRFILPKLLVSPHLSKTSLFTHIFIFIPTGPYYRPQSHILFILHNKHSLHSYDIARMLKKLPNSQNLTNLTSAIFQLYMLSNLFIIILNANTSLPTLPQTIKFFVQQKPIS